jgi:hypothetical protein
MHVSVTLSHTAHGKLWSQVKESVCIIQSFASIVKAHVNRTSVQQGSDVRPIEGQAITVMVQRLFELAFDSGDVAANVGRGCVLPVNLSGINVEQSGLQVAVIQG